MTEAAEDGGGLLRGVRVLDLSRVMSGPYCTSMLADLGAEVIKIEMPDIGDEARHFGPYIGDESAYFMLLNRNKKSVTVNMKTPEGQALIKALIPRCDILVENFRPGVTARLGLDEPAVRTLNPSIIYTSISGFGQDSPLKDLPAFDLVIQAMSGLMSLTGPKGGPATAVGESVADVATGMFAAFGTLAALFDRERTGRGRHVDVAMLDSVVSMQLTGLARQLYKQDTPAPAGNRHPVTYPVDSFPTQDGDIVLVCFSDRVFAALATLMGAPDLPGDPRFATNAARNAHEDHLRARIAAWTRSLTQQAAIDALLAAGVPAGPVWSLADVVASEHAAARGLVASGRHAGLGDAPLVPQPVKFSGAPGSPPAPTTPRLGEHTETVLRDLAGATEDDLAQLKTKGAIAR